MKFQVSGYVAVKITKEIEADSEKEAFFQAQDLEPPELCENCDGADERGRWVFDGMDTPLDTAIQVVVAK